MLERLGTLLTRLRINRLRRRLANLVSRYKVDGENETLRRMVDTMLTLWDIGCINNERRVYIVTHTSSFCKLVNKIQCFQLNPNICSSPPIKRKRRSVADWSRRTDITNQECVDAFAWLLADHPATSHYLRAHREEMKQDLVLFSDAIAANIMPWQDWLTGAK